MFDADALEEQRKYRKMWATPDYRRNSPGLNLAPRALGLLGVYGGDSVRDYGCGVPHAVDYFRRMGLEASGVDLVALREDVVEACLWDLPSDMGPTKWAYCADVLEHLPESRVPAVLAGIRARTVSGAAFSVASTPCKCGRRFGEVLHLTVRPVEWWGERMAEHFRTVATHGADKPWRHILIARP